MSLYTAVGILVVTLMAAAAYLNEWCGILAFAIALLMVFELDMRADAEKENDE